MKPTSHRNLIAAFALLLIGVLFGLLSQPVFAQATTGVILGRVTDPSGAVLQGATVRIVNTETGLTHELKTNGEGLYQSPDLPLGTYDITMEMSGFNTAVAKAVNLAIGQTARVDFSAEIGATTQQLEVQATTASLQTETSSTGQVIGTQTISQLPLNGRNYLDLTKLVPGVVGGVNSHGSEIYQKIGTGFVIQVNGQRPETTSYLVDGVEVRNPWVGAGDLIPSIDALAEFKVQQENFSADMGFGEAIVTSAVKSGTNVLHGSAFEFLRNQNLDATNFFTNAARLPKDPLHRNQWGVTSGGPVKKNKAFFFVSYEGERQRAGQTSFGQVPSVAQRQGNFAGAAVIVNPFSGLPIPGNQIPATSFAQFANATLSYYPLPNTSYNGNNYVTVLNNPTNLNYVGGKGDIYLTSRDTLAMHYLYESQYTTQLNVMPLSGRLFPASMQDGSLSEVHTFAPNLINEIRGNFNWGNVHGIQQATATNVAASQFGLVNLIQEPDLWGLPDVSVSNLTALGAANGGYDPEGAKSGLWQVTDTLTWIKGSHTFKAGVDARRLSYSGLEGSVPRGTVSFNGQFTGNAMADLLLGYAYTATGGAGAMNVAWIVNSTAAFVQDDWRILPNLTLNLGLRWEHYEPPQEGTPQAYLSMTAEQMEIVGQGQWREGIFQSDDKGFAPRVGLAWRPNEKTVVRSAFGMYYFGGWMYGNSISGITEMPPYQYQFSINSLPTTPSINLATDVLPTIPPCSIGCFPGQYPNPNLAGTSYDTSPIMPSELQWNLSIQRQLPGNATLDVGYVGNHGVHIWGRYSINTAVGDTNLNAPTAIQSRRPYPWAGAIRYNNPAYSSWYDGLQAKYERHLFQGFQLLASFSYQKSMDLYSGTSDDDFTDSYKWALSKAISPYNSKFVFVASGIWAIPVGRNREVGAHMSAVGDAFVGGWSLDFIPTFQSGTPVDVTSNTSNNRGGGANRPNVVCNPNIGAPHTIAKWYNTACVVTQLFGAIGDMDRDGTIGPGVNNWNLALHKTFALMPNERMNLQLRGEFFNCWNHTQLQGPASWVVPSTTNGVIAQAATPRQIQVGLKLLF